MYFDILIILIKIIMIYSKCARLQLCSSDDTSCEWLPPDSSLLGGLILKEEIEEELEQKTL